MVKKHDGLRKWLFTRKVLIDDVAFSHSHPILTLSTGIAAKSDLRLLSEFLHEEMHWHLNMHPAELKLAMVDVKSEYPNVKVGREQGGARNEESTYLHLLVCYLELETPSELIGQKRARRVVRVKPYYRWIYRKVASDTLSGKDN